MLFKGEISEEIQRISNIYISDISKIPLLDKDKQRDLFIAWYKYRNIDARNKLIISNLRLVVKIALFHYKKIFPLPELVAVGNTGLIDAVNKFDVERGTKFSSFAYERITGKIKRYIKTYSEEIRTPENIIDKKNNTLKEYELILKKEGIDNFDYQQTESRIIDDIEDNTEEKKEYYELYQKINRLKDLDKYLIITHFKIKIDKPRIDIRNLGDDVKQKKRVKEILNLLK